MFNPSDLEGEVDHSFFDSDCDDSGISRDGGKKMEKGLMAKKESPPAHERLHAKQTENSKDDWPPTTDRTEKDLTTVKKSRRNRAERKENSCQSKEEERSRASSVSSVACTSGKILSNCSDDEEDSSLDSVRPRGTFMALLAEAREVDNQDVDCQSSNETEEETLPPNAKTSGSKGRSNLTPKKRIRNRHTRSPSPTSTEASVDADSESSCSRGNGRSSFDSRSLPRPTKTSLSHRVRRMRLGSAGSRDMPTSNTEESDDTVTDVSPLSSPDSSPLQSLDLSHTLAKEGSVKEQQQQQQQEEEEEEEESVPSSGLRSIHQDGDSDQDVDECSLSPSSRLGSKLALHYPGGRNRKNFSFTNEEVQSIDRENQRLLRELSRLSSGPRPGSTAGKKTHVASNPPLMRLAHSARNRQRAHQRIDRENQAFMKRLESVKPTPGLKRSEQLADYQRLVGYLRAPSYPICVSTTKRGRSTSNTPPAGPRPGSSAFHSSRAVSTTTDSSNTPVRRSKKLSPTPPAWC